MNYNLAYFITMIQGNEKIDDETKKKIISYIYKDFYYKVFASSKEDYENVNHVLMDLNYDIEKFQKYVTFAYGIRNAINDKTGNYRVKPNTNYLLDLYNVTKKINFDYLNYSLGHKLSNVTLARTMFRLMNKKEMLNNEVSILDFANRICDKCYLEESRNDALYYVLKAIDMVERGIVELGVEGEKIFLSEEVEELFSMKHLPHELALTDIIKEFYPIFGKDVFKMIKECSMTTDEEFNTNTLMRYLRNSQDRLSFISKHKDRIKASVKRIELDSEKAVSELFVDLFVAIQDNKYIDDSLKKNILDNISAVYQRYKVNQDEFLDEELDKFFSNCTMYLNDLIIPSKERKDKIDKLMSSFLNECKDFFLEYDAKKFKELVDFVIHNTDLNGNDLIGVKDKCLDIFKNANVAKLKEIQSSLKEFRTFINNVDSDNNSLNEDIFENILLEKPELLVQNNNLKEVLQFLKGDVSLRKHGYQGADFKLSSNLYSFDFLKKLATDDYEVLFKTDIGTIVGNLNFIETVCSTIDINFRELKINEDMIMMLLQPDFINIDYSFTTLNELFTSEELKTLLEANPNILGLNKRELSLMVTRCISNENPDFTFDKLLASELYYYDKKNYDGIDDKVILDRDFKYVNLNFKEKNIDIENLLLDTHLFDGLNADDLFNLYTDRNKKYNKMNKTLSQLETKEYGFKEFYDATDKLLNTYKELYKKVPNLTLLERIRETISTRIEDYQMRISDSNDLIESKTNLLNIYQTEKDDSIFTRNILNNAISMISSDVIKEDINKFLKHLDSNRIKESESKIEEISKLIEDINNTIKILDREAEHLDYSLRASDPNVLMDDIMVEHNMKPSFTINSLTTRGSEKEKTDEELIKEAMNGRNVIVFSNGVDLEDIPNDRHFIEKVNKFLGEGDSSLTSYEFMNTVTSGNNTDYIEMYGSYRARICARRENRTQVRVYYIPVHTKYFTCYFITGVNYKDHSHVFAGMEDAVYASKIEDAINLEKVINSMTIEEALVFIKQQSKIYQEEMKPIFDKYNAFQNKKKKNSNNKK